MVLALGGAAIWFCTAMPGASWRQPLAATPQEEELARQLRQHVEAVASREHNLDYPEALDQSASYIAATLRGYGYKVQPQEYAVETRRVS